MMRDTENPYESPAVPTSRSRRVGLVVVLLLAGAVVLVGALLWQRTIAAERAEQEALRARELARAQAELATRAAEDLMMKEAGDETPDTQQTEETNE